MAMSHTSQLVELFTQLGLAVNWKKSAPWPSQKVTYLGLFLDMGIMRARLSDGRTESILSALRLCRPPCRRRVQEIMSLLGLMSAAHAVVTLGLLDMRALQRWFARQKVDPVRHRRRMLIIPYTLAGDLDYWRNPAVLERGVPLGTVSAVTQVLTDAPLTGWGGVCQGQAHVWDLLSFAIHPRLFPERSYALGPCEVTMQGSGHRNKDKNCISAPESPFSQLIAHPLCLAICLLEHSHARRETE
ncbi:hypothetical protein DPEC_G00192060 [Dallia pectoralis]|uniref:Uncharacterized protein n=1 Tax=Dallia pectoralis TaxID=75939 RepID=A0ACC2GC31_DALPE|nr:hypothetical protein DPEC_G00192060 [Dallia pectoralis]